MDPAALGARGPGGRNVAPRDRGGERRLDARRDARALREAGRPRSCCSRRRPAVAHRRAVSRRIRKARDLPTANVNGVWHFYELNGPRDPRALVMGHGSWTSHRTWHLVVPKLA